MKSSQFVVKSNNSVEFKDSGTYTISNCSVGGTLEVVGRTNSVTIFDLHGLSMASVHSDTGIKLFSKDIDISVNLNIESDDEVHKPVGDKSLKGKTFCIDAGHGGSDPGAVNGEHQEKDTALKICIKLAEMLGLSDANVLLTRSGDTKPGLSERAEMANRKNCDAFISVHLNSSDSKSATGHEVLVYNDRTDTKAYKLAKNINHCIELAVPWRNRGIKARPDLIVLKKTTMPAVLVEVGFISNDTESKSMTTDYTQTNLARAIFNGIRDTYGNGD